MTFPNDHGQLRRRKRHQFSIRSLIIVSTAICAIAGTAVRAPQVALVVAVVICGVLLVAVVFFGAPVFEAVFYAWLNTKFREEEKEEKEREGEHENDG